MSAKRGGTREYSANTPSPTPVRPYFQSTGIPMHLHLFLLQFTPPMSLPHALPCHALIPPTHTYTYPPTTYIHNTRTHALAGGGRPVLALTLAGCVGSGALLSRLRTHARPTVFPSPLPPIIISSSSSPSWWASAPAARQSPPRDRQSPPRDRQSPPRDRQSLPNANQSPPPCPSRAGEHTAVLVYCMFRS